jgi:acetylornithine/succinyldiaminopimelate/putrescine aminotransferase
MRLPPHEVLKSSLRYLELIAGKVLNKSELESFIGETVRAYEQHVNRGFISYRKSITEAGQFAALEWEGQGSILRDAFGREYIDCLGGYGIFSCGINHPRIVQAVTDQLKRMALNSQELLEPWRAALASLLADITPGELACSFFINNGTDAIEGAIKLARLHTKRNTFLSTIGGFHGKSMGALSLIGKATFREPFAGGLQDVRFAPYGDAQALEAEFAKAAAVGTPFAAFIVEPVQGEAGAIVPPSGYMSQARELCTKHGTLLIVDEVQTGLGRTGAMWGVDHSNVTPDILCLGKALGGGVMPLAAFVSTPRIWECMVPNPTIHSTTFGGNPLACVAGIAAISVTLEEDLPGQAAAKGQRLLRDLERLRDRYPQLLTAVRGMGFLIGLEFPSDKIGYDCAAGLFRRGVLVAGTYSKARTIRIEPALGISGALLDEVMNRLEDTLEEIAISSRTPTSSRVAAC